ncbi:predicted protein [Naegleria gruberi]|uniref:peptidyl-tRNA hydrolase n=1 Tax=Naegleria gruberi TaxID=5762 RepID=D2VQW5_NAEGR|nr:uncharacterized protein NAEGRDRAFT_71370 [Naegleria gruberi]EFC40785.1 predicted protein [Naegleria gruberi]|eukprot:XP_002673529.1 predicted protein [Naegleria gruberi strain NEG-M]
MSENQSTSEPQLPPQANATIDTIVQYIVIRRDLMQPPYSYAIGSIVSQGSHASVSIISESLLIDKDPITLNYVDANAIHQMHTIVLECPSEKQLLSLRDDLDKNQMKYKLWVEQPENIPTSIALKPYPRSLVAKFVKKFKLFK